MKIMNGFRARFDLYIDGNLASRPGAYYVCHFAIREDTNSDIWFQDLIPMGDGIASTNADWWPLQLQSMTLLPEGFLYAQLTVKTLEGNLMCVAQPWKCWLPPDNWKDAPGTVDHLSQGLWSNMKKRMVPCVLVSTVIPMNLRDEE